MVKMIKINRLDKISGIVHTLFHKKCAEKLSCGDVLLLLFLSFEPA
jgi:hypothetical protein